MRESLNKDWIETLYIPPLEGKHKFWTRRIKKESEYRDYVISLGNNLSLKPLEDNSYPKDNSKTFMGLHVFSKYSENWINLVGKNEMTALSLGPGKLLDIESYETLLDSWLSPDSHYSAATESNGALVTASGLTHGEWVSIGKPKTAKEAAHLLNLKYKSTLYQGPSATLGSSPNYSASPLWADSALELLPSWVVANEACPFKQIYSSLGFRLDGDNDALDNPYTPLYYIDSITKRSFGRVISIKGSMFFDIDNDNLIDEEKMKHNNKGFSSLYLERVPR